MAKSETLTAVEMGSFKAHPGIADLVERYQEKTEIPAQELRVLDWGCGRGRTVAWFLEKGFSAYGVDIDPTPIRNAGNYYHGRGWDPDLTLKLFSPEGKAPFPDSFFHVTVSDQVLEHVKDLEGVARELNRVSRPGAVGLHIFPSYRTWMEPHLFMPVVHWLPKNGLMKGAIRFFLAFGLGPKWPELRNLSNRDKSEKLFRYCVEKTHYRKPAEILSIFERAGFEARFVVTERPGGWLARVPRGGLAGAVVAWVRSRFFMTEIRLQKNSLDRI